VQTRTNLVKPFIKSGVFPFNPNAIDRSRILKKYTSTITSSSNINNSNDVSNNAQIDTNHIIDNSRMSIHPNPTVIENHSMNDDSSSSSVVTSFATSSDAISSLNRILQYTTFDQNDYKDDDDSDDNDYEEDLVSNEDVSSISISKSSSKKSTVRSSNRTPPRINQKSNDSPLNYKRKTSTSRIIGFDTSDDDSDEACNVIDLILLK
jgi:hypothetical protein